ncbi:MAG: MAPEG family protein [Hyphomicrobiaceae bacterium]
MTQLAILYPVFVQVLLTLAVYPALLMGRKTSLQRSGGRFTDPDVALGHHTWSEEATKRSNNLRSQFELPVLFYAVVAFALIAKGADLIMIVLAWLFVVLRIAHAAIHLGSNDVQKRGPIFGFGLIVIFLMWVKLAVHVATAGV